MEFRDWQWRNRVAGKQFPDLMINLEGNAEEYMGDAQIKFNERLYLFEIKSTHATVPEEWNDKKKIKTGKKDKKGEDIFKVEPNPKEVYKKIMRELIKTKFTDLPNELKSNDHYYHSAKIKYSENILRSLVCHHFLFWEKGDFRIDPYLIKVAEKNGIINGPFNDTDGIHHFHHFIKSFSMGLALLPTSPQKNKNNKFVKAEFFHPSHFQDRTSLIIKSNSSNQQSFSYCHTGLPLDAFQEYVDWLCGDACHEIHVLLMSDKGTIFQEIFHTNDLKKIIAKFHQQPDPASEAEIHKEYSIANPMTAESIIDVDSTPSRSPSSP